MTEEEAKTRRCCGPVDCGRNANTDLVYNAGDTECVGYTVTRMCIGSACMGWRPFVENRAHGYCGLAGVP
jgi:hypothetical protein